ncbi:hypothetical protein MSG28_000442 [Choristoneura fumiferana]|uniref:Uncharacterized protein n=1 Tax=Choristoneura fumiferana TaxID=7141 RepID=A0ACC0K0T1_CHOFU|nr:hypothetical protein MSG28_000442 [Choristoneura fumiferana]
MDTRGNYNINSMETILTFDNRDNQSEWSVEWSTEYVPGMGTAAGSSPRRREAGRRRLRLGALAMGSALVMHCRVAAAALTGGFIVFYLSLVLAVAALANPHRHFEVYLGQWSISGPGRAFRLLPMLDGIGIAMCIYSIVRAISCCTIAAIAMVDWDLKAYDPISKNVTAFRLRQGRFSIATAVVDNRTLETSNIRDIIETTTVGMQDHAWRRVLRLSGKKYIKKITPHKILMCNETYSGGFPSLYINMEQRVSVVRDSALGLGFVFSCCGCHSGVCAEKNGISDALEIALYIHSAGTGTELIHGKGLNHFASGHIDPMLNGDNVWHSCALLLLAGLHASSAAVCALADIVQPDTSTAVYALRESTLWIIPMYSKCTSAGSYSHAISTMVFGGLCFSYILVAYILLKTALHTIFEYRVKLVFVEQVVVAALILTCMALSLPFATTGGLALLESMEAMMCGLTMPLVCLLELTALMVVYRGHDFALIISKIVTMSESEMPAHAMAASVAPLLGALLAVPLRACHNAYVFLKPAPRLGT